MSNRAARAMIALSIAVVVPTIAMWVLNPPMSMWWGLIGLPWSHALGAALGILGASILAFGEEDHDSTCLAGFAAGFACLAHLVFDLAILRPGILG